MSMLANLLVPLLSFAGQDPTAVPASPASSAPAPAPAPQRWLPASTLAALTLAPSDTDPELATLFASDEAEALQRVLQRVLGPLTREAGVDPALITNVLRNGCALGLVGFDKKGMPDLLFVGNVGDRAGDVLAAIAKLPPASDGLRVWSRGPQSCYLNLVGTHFAIGTVSSSVAVALARATGATDSASGTLADEADFAGSLAKVPGSQIAHVFVRVGVLTRQVIDKLPPPAATPARSVADALRLPSIDWAGGTCSLDAGELVTRYELAMPVGNDLLGAIAGTTDRLDVGLARLVPSSATGYGFFAVDLGDVFEQVLSLATAVEPGIAAPFEQARARIEGRTGIDAQAALLGSLTGRIAMLSFAGEGGDDLGVMIELGQASNFQRALGRLLPALPLPLQSGTCAGLPCWRLPAEDAGKTPALAVVENWLVIASADSVLAQLVRQLQAPQANPTVAEFLRSLPSGCTWAGQGPAAMLPGPLFDGVRASLGDLGTQRTILRRRDDGFEVEQRVAAADVLRITSAVVTVAGAQLAGIVGELPAAGSTDDGAGVEPDVVALLRQAEDLGPTNSSVTALSGLLEHPQPKVAARAAWLLGEWRARTAIEALGVTATRYPEPSVRVQAMAALARIVDPAVAPAATAAATDGDRRVRTLAVQALGRLGPELALKPVLGLLDAHGSELPNGTPSDLIAALVVVHDLGDATQLLPAAAAIGFAQPQVGQALAFLFQGLSPKLAPKDEATTLLAVLDHPEPLLRRYAIQRLGELRDPTTSRALEKRLAAEGPDLQPLIRVSLTQVRGDVQHTDDDLVDRAKSNVAAIAEMVEARWRTLDDRTRLYVLGGAGGLLLLLVTALVMRRRTRRRRAAIASAALVGPSTDFRGRRSPAGGSGGFDEGPELAGVGMTEEEERF